MELEICWYHIMYSAIWKAYIHCTKMPRISQHNLTGLISINVSMQNPTKKHKVIKINFLRNNILSPFESKGSDFQMTILPRLIKTGKNRIETDLYLLCLLILETWSQFFRWVFFNLTPWLYTGGTTRLENKWNPKLAVL